MIVGAGIIGLYTVFELLQKGESPSHITVIAQHLPGDQSINYASPYAGAYFNPFADDVSFPKHTYKNFDRIDEFLGYGESGIKRTFTEEHFSEDLLHEDLAAVDFLPDLSLAKSTKPQCFLKVLFTGITFNPPLFIAKLMHKFEKLGVRFIQRRLNSLEEAFEGLPKKAVFNCSGLGAKQLANDSTVFLTRGQVVVIRAPHVDKVVSSWTQNASTYIIPRPFSNTHEVVLGGFYQPHVFDANTYKVEVDDILQRTTELYPEILANNPMELLEILRVVAGSRPSREEGVRIERENTLLGPILHNYGAGGQGYICGLGMAHKNVLLLSLV